MKGKPGLTRVYKVCGFLIFLILLTIILILVNRCSFSNIRENLNKKSGVISTEFQRVSITPRKDRAERLEKVGLDYYDDPAIEWNHCE